MLASTGINSTANILRNITVTVNGKPLEAKKGETVLELCDRNNIRIPRLCFHPNLPPKASCRVCLVECDGKWLSPACVTTVWDGLKIDTKSKNVRDSVENNLKELLDCHDETCSACIANHRCQFRDMNVAYSVKAETKEICSEEGIDESTNAIRLDTSKCVLCGRCIRACEEVAGTSAIIFGNRAKKMRIQPTFGVTLQETSCIKCGQCTLYCPVGAITEKSQVKEALDILANKGKKITVVQVAPAVRVALSEAFGYKEGTVTTGKMVSALKALGFDLVYDTNYGADLTICEEAGELVNRLRDPNAKFPMFTSCCPAWVNYVEQSAPDFIPNLSSCRSPQGMLSALIKNYLPKLLDVKQEDVLNFSIMPCTAKKDEVERPELRTKSGLKETDMVLTVRELVEMIKLSNIDFNNLPDTQFDNIFGFGSGAGQIFAATGGVMEAASRTAFEVYTGKKLTNVNIYPVRGMDGLRIAELDLDGTKLKVAVCHGIANTAKLLDRLREKDPELMDIKFIEIMACPGGCVCGGGTPQPKNRVSLDNRLAAIYNIDAKMECRKSHENPLIKGVYKEFLGKPNSHLAHELLHTHFKHHPKW
ncbi:64kDa iron hydrogenase, putative [Trichomonas vaginalis G3]|uniref:64kDa iron hydrogenase, putative n=1 Tax=Trichomonas vaginalis (strain ATCC PRA-98 / G3) TaxID=412133 RepID=A2FCW4_TRIV3|nr:iron-sulfur cluster assembly [Trichomonas vaginalis G3]EAX97250.1 64kDa iron hydrogenase, putative [Trichomonas vaginalis G3]KAI5535855.1 iron-sulfur cluster assembly [Trichomonas vaginalis G3]|eukprot:XP_001310180.1 64kDa iron hydrogenase [Trichomonas vaginalis G3]